MNKISAIFLTGGQSSRMGERKDLLKFNNKYFSEIILEKLKNICDDVIIVDSNVYRQRHLNATIVKDLWPNKGVLAALYSGLLQQNNNLAILCPCDQPLIKIEILELLKKNLLSYYKNQALIIQFNLGKKHKIPLLAGYSKECLNTIKNQIENNHLKINRLNEKIAATQQIQRNDILKLDSKLISFQNINYANEYNKLKNMYT